MTTDYDYRLLLQIILQTIAISTTTDYYYRLLLQTITTDNYYRLLLQTILQTITTGAMIKNPRTNGIREG